MHERPQATTIYGTTMARLQAVKAIYDPENIFRLNQNIEPAPPSMPASA